MSKRTTGLYHGTRAAFRGSGGLVLPGETFGVDNHRLARSQRVYVTPNLELAKAYALACSGTNRARVLEVLPTSPLTTDDSTVNGDEQEAYGCDAATVLRVVWKEER